MSTEIQLNCRNYIIGTEIQFYYYLLLNAAATEYIHTGISTVKIIQLRSLVKVAAIPVARAIIENGWVQ